MWSSWVTVIICLHITTFLTSVHAKSDVLKIDRRFYRPDKSEVFWMHIQKTSAWLDNFLAVWACPTFSKFIYGKYKHIYDKNPSKFSYFSSATQYFRTMNISADTMLMKSTLMNCSVNINGHLSGLGWHTSYMDPSMNGTVVSLFRKPSSRIISAFLFDILIPFGFTNRTIAEREVVKESIKKAEHPIYTYATWPGISGCQTKMVLGYGCGEDLALTKSHLEG